MSVEPSAQQALQATEAALEAIEPELEAASKAHTAALPRLEAAERVLAPLVVQERGLEAVAMRMPVSSGGYQYGPPAAAKPGDLTVQIAAARLEFEAARTAANLAHGAAVSLKRRVDLLRRNRRALREQLGLAGD